MQSDLRRAVSSAYYGMFHCLAANGADLLIGGPGAQRSEGAWRQVYRALSHGDAKEACLRSRSRPFPPEIQDFARQFVTMQRKRHEADYSPERYYHKSDVAILIDEAEDAIREFGRASATDRRAFAVWVLFKARRQP